MSIKETIEVIKDAVHERISSPILGSFSFFFVGCNWPTIVTLIRTTEPIEQAITSLEEARISWFHSFFEPAIFTILFCGVYPWIKYGLSWYTDWVDTKRIIKRHSIELQILQNRKQILAAEVELEEIRNTRARDAERQKIEFEYELKSRQQADADENRRQKAHLENELERDKALSALETERIVQRQREKYGMVKIVNS